MNVYYNEFDPFASAWLRKLIEQGLIPAGDVDTRSITEVKADELKGYTQCHFFAGIGGWAHALTLAGWEPDRPVWTGSCPCQPFSSAGKRCAQSDERHLWPTWSGLIRECRPPVVFGEQVAAAVAHGWWDDVAADLEREGYACAAAVLPACSVGAPHKRDRLWFVAHAESERSSGASRARSETVGRQTIDNSHKSWGASNVANPERTAATGWSDSATGGGGGAYEGREVPAQRGASPSDARNAGDCNSIVGDTFQPRLEGFSGDEQRLPGREKEDRPITSADTEWVACPDGKSRPVEPGICLLADGFPNRVGALRGFGNAIVPEVAAEFIIAYRECRGFL